ncbi:Uncharacterized protein conserved in bacteria (DUF2057) [Serratia rubidaea]|uniref:Uncharacterized protein conserved in bacteria (DUF2057) n=1 Tax=Serratia rubidaea TaxID=61652 RepID=A0A4U9HCG5_SERRU|nr:Uncharacterized protein conserved in bacteria (DUF2057) [Serratia rubidaea]
MPADKEITNEICLVVTGLLGVCLSLPAVATTLKLSPDIELLVVDGKQMTGSLLKGADSLELNGGQHQLLFKVSKPLHAASQPPSLYTSPLMLVAFNTHNVSTVAIQLPPIDSQQDGQRFEQQQNYQVIDKQGKALPAKRDILRITPPYAHERLEKTVADYNRQPRPAAVPAFARQSADDRERLSGAKPWHTP